jgi:hypothetical protein
MSRESRIIDRLNQRHLNTANNLVTVDTETTLWPRFKKVREAIASALITQQEPQVERKLETFHWSGYDHGIHDHKGEVKGTVKGITLDIDIKGTTVEGQARVVVDKSGEWKIEHVTEHNLEISGDYVSPDGKKGSVRILINKNLWTEAYWLQIYDGSFRLEQVVNSQGEIYDVQKLDSGNDEVVIPKTNFRFPRYF